MIVPVASAQFRIDKGDAELIEYIDVQDTLADFGEWFMETPNIEVKSYILGQSFKVIFYHLNVEPVLVDVYDS